MANVLVLVPRGAEYQAVNRAIAAIPGDRSMSVLAIPVGRSAVGQWLAQQEREKAWAAQPPTKILVFGLCGSLRDSLGIGQAVTYHTCHDDRGETWSCLPILHPEVVSVCGFSSDRIVHLATDKKTIAQTSGADVVDMEAAAILTYAARHRIPVSILRVISDDVHHDLPDLGAAIDASGHLQPLPLAVGLIKQPIAALRLIRGSLQSLAKLEQIAHQILS
jgi:nucleoside phosphorylase